MKLKPNATHFVLVVLVAIGTLNGHALLGSTGDERTFSEVGEEIQTAISDRNFHDAMTSLELLLPIMKKDIKKSKKHLVELQKAEEPDINPDEFSESITKKETLYASIKDYCGMSSAAFRVKAEALVEMIDDYSKLVDNS